eukprot:GHVS01021540.1.p1 GENE.GHVS01021540.1~~GHVS01021540.1.p1  ORF type:complete len:355 (+),score=41.61 GHVS01021540.1:32-1096(+)
MMRGPPALSQNPPYLASSSAHSTVPPYIQRNAKSSFHRSTLQTSTLPTSSFPPPPPPSSGQRFSQLHPSHASDGVARVDEGSRGPKVDLVGRVVTRTVGLFESFFCLKCHLPMATRMRTLPCFHVFCEECGWNMVDNCPTCDCKISGVERLHPDDDLRQCAAEPNCLKSFLNDASLHYHYKHDHGVTIQTTADTSQPSEPLPSAVGDLQVPPPSSSYLAPSSLPPIPQYSDAPPSVFSAVPNYYTSPAPTIRQSYQQVVPPPRPPDLLDAAGRRDSVSAGQGMMDAGGKIEANIRGPLGGREGRAAEGTSRVSAGAPTGIEFAGASTGLKIVESSPAGQLAGDEEEDDDLEDLI